MELRVGNRYRLGRKIGSGSFGDIYLGKEGGSWGRTWGSVALWRTSGAGPGCALLAAVPTPSPRRGWAGGNPRDLISPRLELSLCCCLINLL